jgi:4-amino-4-deoxy-L-arabinose transferase-like glycosyltransferase
MDERRRSTRGSAARLALVLGALSVGWSIGLALAGGFDVDLFGIRIRSNDPLRTVIYAVFAFAIYGVLRVRAGRGTGAAPPAGTVRAALPLVLILSAAALVRVWGLTFGLPNLLARPDEDAVASIATSLFSGDLNPRSFTYPPLFMLAVAAAMRVVEVVHGYLTWLGMPSDLVVGSSVTKFLIARVLSAAAGVVTVAVLFRTALRLFDRRVALAAATCLAFAFLHVRDSHFGVTDVPMTFMLAVAFLQVATLSQSGATRALVGAAIAAGLAMATKYNAALVAVPAAFALLADPLGRPLASRLGRVALFGALMLLVFLAVAPFSIVEHEQFLFELRRVSTHLREGHGVFLGRGWVYHATTTLPHGLGPPLLAAGVGGALWLLWRRPRTGLLVSLFPAVYYVVAGSGYNVFTRHMQPMVPFLCLTAGYALVEAAGWVTRLTRRPSWAPGVAAVAVAAAIAPSACSVFRFDQLLARTDSRLVARRWIEARFPPGTTIAQPGPDSGRVVHFTPEEVAYISREILEGGPEPDIVIVQWSPLQGTTPAGEHGRLLAGAYDLRLALHVAADDPANVYDRQDDFYLPMAGFRGIERPGPNLHVYVRRGAGRP